MRFHVGGAAEVEFLTTFVSLHVLISELFSTQMQLTLCRTVSSSSRTKLSYVQMFVVFWGYLVSVLHFINQHVADGWDRNVSTVLILDECWIHPGCNDGIKTL